MIAVGAKVLLKDCPHGEPGCVVRIERNRAVVLWHDLDFQGRHRQDSLVEVSNGDTQSGLNSPKSPEKSPQFSQGVRLCA